MGDPNPSVQPSSSHHSSAPSIPTTPTAYPTTATAIPTSSSYTSQDYSQQYAHYHHYYHHYQQQGYNQPTPAVQPPSMAPPTIAPPYYPPPGPYAAPPPGPPPAAVAGYPPGYVPVYASGPPPPAPPPTAIAGVVPPRPPAPPGFNPLNPFSIPPPPLPPHQAHPPPSVPVHQVAPSPIKKSKSSRSDNRDPSCSTSSRRRKRSRSRSRSRSRERRRDHHHRHREVDRPESSSRVRRRSSRSSRERRIEGSSGHHRERKSEKIRDVRDLGHGSSKRLRPPSHDDRIRDHHRGSGDRISNSKRSSSDGRLGAEILHQPPPHREVPLRKKSVDDSKNKRHLSPARGPTRKPPTTYEDKERMVKEHMKLTPEQILQNEKKVWTRSAPADLYYQRDHSNPNVSNATDKLISLLDRFQSDILDHIAEGNNAQPKYEPPKINRLTVAKCRPSRGCCSEKKKKDNTKNSAMSHSHNDHNNKKANNNDESSSSSSSDDDENEDHNAKNEALEWLEHRAKQPFRLHEELWDNQANELNDGPVCRCSIKARKIGIRHGIYQGEDSLPKVEMKPHSNNADTLYHYRIAISPPTNFLDKKPTVIPYDQHEFVFEGFSMFTTEKLKDLPLCNVVRFSIKYSILYLEEKMPDNVTFRELQLFHQYFFKDLLQLKDWDVQDRFYFMPRFVRDLPENGKEILSMNIIMKYLLDSYTPVVDEMDLIRYLEMNQMDWLNNITEPLKGMLVTCPGMKPGAIRVDQLDREQEDEKVIKYPEIVHFGTRPQQLCYAGNAEYQKVWREYIKSRHLLANMPKPTFKDKRNIETMEEKLNEMRANIKMKREVAVAVSSQGFYKTGLRTDIVQHGLLLPVLVNHLRLHASLDYFEEFINYKFKNRGLLQLAMTHPSYKENYGTNPDHSRNTLSNCGIRQPEYGDRRVHSASNRKRGINMLINIMSRFGKEAETESKVAHNERLEFLGDAVVEFITSVHLFHMFPDLEEGGLATYRAALVQNQHLAILAEVLGLEKYMLYAHGSDLCHDTELRHAMANCFEALMGAIYLDGGIDQADRIFAFSLFGAEPDLHETWVKFDPHPLQMQEPRGDRHWIETYPILQKMADYEKQTGIEFTHIRLLARSMSDRSLSLSNLTMGSNQRMEFLGDTVLQLVTSDYLYKHFPEHHEGHLSLLRSSIVNNRTQAVVCDDLGITKYALFAVPKKDLKIKDRADLLEAFLGALYIDKDLEYCRVFANVCFFPRLQQFIINQEWNDPKSKLQQCCLTLRTIDGGEPDIPVYKVIESKGPTNTRVYTVAVYFKGDRLAKAEGPSIQTAEMNAAKIALDTCGHLFPHLDYQKKIVERSLRKNKDHMKQSWEEEVRRIRKEKGLDELNEKCSKRNDERLKLKILHKKQQQQQPAAQQSNNHHNNITTNIETRGHSGNLPGSHPVSRQGGHPKSHPGGHIPAGEGARAPTLPLPGPPPALLTQQLPDSANNIKKPIISQPKKKKPAALVPEEPRELEEGECSDDSDE